MRFIDSLGFKLRSWVSLYVATKKFKQSLSLSISVPVLLLSFPTPRRLSSNIIGTTCLPLCTIVTFDVLFLSHSTFQSGRLLASLEDWTRMRNDKAPSSSNTHHTFQGDEKRLVAKCLAVPVIAFAELIHSVATPGEDQSSRGGEEAAEDVEPGWEVDWLPHTAAAEEIVAGGDAEDDEGSDLEAETSEGNIDAGR